MDNPETLQKLRNLIEEYLQIEYIKKRSGLNGKEVAADLELSILRKKLSSVAAILGLSKNKLREFKTEINRTLRASQTSSLREARKTPGLKSRKIRSNAAKGSSVYSLPKASKLWRR